MSLRISQCLLAALFSGVLQSASAAPIIFDDFNVNEGHFNLAPNFAGQTTGATAASTADRVVAGSLEGAGAERLVFVHDGAANLRIRFLSGGAGVVANNVPFNVGPETDGFIGFFLKTNAQNYTVALNLDGADGVAGSMDMGVTREVIGDGQWHLYEWDLDDPGSWTVVTSIGGNGVLDDGSHTIDSIYFFDGSGEANQADPEILLDFVAKNDAGSVGLLIPEPCSVGLVLLGSVALLGRRSRRRVG